MNQQIDIKDLPQSIQAEIADASNLIPEKYNVYAKIILLVGNLKMADGLWCVRKVKRELEKIAYYGGKEGKKKSKKNKKVDNADID